MSVHSEVSYLLYLFLFNVKATSENYPYRHTHSLHDALPIYRVVAMERVGRFGTDSCSPVGLGGFTGCTQQLLEGAKAERQAADKTDRSEEHTSELQSLMRISYAVFCLKKKKKKTKPQHIQTHQIYKNLRTNNDTALTH